MLKFVPNPQEIIEREGSFILGDDINVLGDLSENIKIQLKNVLLPIVGTKIHEVSEDTKGSICFTLDKDIQLEGYNLIVNENGITIKASDDRGFFYAIMTIYQLISSTGRELPLCEIKDYPRFRYRSFMIDVGRYFFPVKDIKTFIDVCAILKLNVLHMHLTEDQGWRIEIDKYPLLTEQGSKRKNTNGNCKEHSGFFTKEDIKLIVDYAHSKYISVVPEIDMPGHMESAISCYKHLGCFDREIDVATHFGVKHDILCAGKETTYEFVKDVLDEVMDMFPDGCIHLGGDEAVKHRWNLCPKCKKKMEELGVDADGLQSVFMNEMARFVKERGYTPIVWNERKKDDILDKDVIWNYYMPAPDCEKAMVDEINNGRKCINVNSDAYYYDLPYHDVPLKNAYNYDPIIKGIDKDKIDSILGVECDLWTEYVPNMKVASKKLFPRIFAMAETSWTNEENKDYEEFIIRLEPLQEIMYSITGYPSTTVKQANPGKIKGFFEKLWFEKRQLFWEGAKILIEDNKIERQVKKGKLGKD